MSDIFLPSLEHKFNNNNKNNIYNKLKINHLYDHPKSFRTYLLEKNYINTNKHNSLKKTTINKSVNYKRHLNNDQKIYINKNRFKNDLKGFLKNRTDIEIINNKIAYKKSNSLINKTFNKYFINNKKSFDHYNNLSMNNKLDYTLNKNSKRYLNTDIYNDDIDPYFTYRKVNKNEIEKKKHPTEVNKIINSLINSTATENRNKYKIQKKIKKFPREKSIDPISQIKYNLQYNPHDRKLYKGINEAMKQLGKSPLKEEYENDLIKKASDIINLKVESDHIEAPLGEAKIYLKKFEDMINQTKRYKSFQFNKNKNPENKIKVKKYKPEMKILDKTYKIYFNKKFGIKKKLKNKGKIDTELEKNIDKYISFDRRINNILYISKNTEDNINKKSLEHKDMLNKFNFMLNSYLQ